MGQTLDKWGWDNPFVHKLIWADWASQVHSRRGAQIVICGRVAHAAPTIGAAAWWWD